MSMAISITIHARPLTSGNFVSIHLLKTFLPHSLLGLCCQRTQLLLKSHFDYLEFRDKRPMTVGEGEGWNEYLAKARGVNRHTA